MSIANRIDHILRLPGSLRPTSYDSKVFAQRESGMTSEGKLDTAALAAAADDRILMSKANGTSTPIFVSYSHREKK